MKYILLYFILFAAVSAKSQSIIPAIYNSALVIDGIKSPGEWDSSSTVTFTAPSNTLTFSVAFDSTYLYVLAYGKLESASILFPEVVTDANNAKSASWQTDDWWFHVSATDCENQGTYGIYSNCLLVQPDWLGVPNFAAGLPYTDTVEMSFDWTKIGFNPFTQNNLGISFLVTNTSSVWYGWPAGFNRNSPSTWGTLIFSNASSSEETAFHDEIILFPNPSDGKINIKLPDWKSGDKYFVINQFGQIINENILTREQLDLQIDKSGIYYLVITDKNGWKILSRKISIIR